MEKINFEDGKLISKGYVMIDGIKYETEEPIYNGKIPLSAHYLNKIQENVESSQTQQDTKIAALEAKVVALEETVGNIASMLDSINGEVV